MSEENAPESLVKLCKVMERERDEAREQRDRLAEACQNLIDVKGRHHTEIAFDKVQRVLAAVKGGAHETPLP